MARIRSIKPEFWADEDLAELPRDARLLYMGLWNLADEHGRLRGDARYVKGQLFAYDDDLTPKAVDALIDLLHKAGKAVRYSANGKPYVYLPNLARHQRLEPEKVASRLPAPPADESARVSTVDADSSESRADKIAPREEDHALLYGAWSMEQGGAAQTLPRGPADEPPPRTCDKHRDDPVPPDCGRCAGARRKAEAWEAQRRRRLDAAPKCPRHPQELAEHCRLCAADRKGRA